MDNMPVVMIYTDGASVGNPGPGGYGVILVSQSSNRRRELSGGFRMTTNNRMEMMAAIVGLEALQLRCRVTIYSDSKYLVDSIELGWVHKWKSNGWRRNAKESAVNVDLWERLLDIRSQHVVDFEWVKGHSGHPENDRCDELAESAARSGGLAEDTGYVPSRVRAGSSSATARPRVALT